MKFFDGESGFDLLRDPWRELIAAQPSYFISQTPDYCRICWNVVAKKKGRQLGFLLKENSRGPVLLVPYVSYKKHGLTFVEPLSSDLALEPAEFLSVPDVSDDDLRDAVEAIAERTRADVFRLALVPEETALCRVAEAELRPSMRWTIETSWLSIKEYADFDAFRRQTFNSKVLSNRRRLLRQLKERGAFEMKKETGPAKSEAVTWIVAQKRAWLKQNEYDNPRLATATYEEFLQAIASASIDGGAAEIYSIRIDGEIIAAQLGAHDRTRFAGFMIAHNPEYSVFSPGVLLNEFVLSDLFAMGLDYDAGIGSERWKDPYINRKSHAHSFDMAYTHAGGVYVAVRKAIDLMPANIEMKLRNAYRKIGR
jgi:CelD/BcsL family acetyltransferase involved in cellulose biosynthesis